MCAFQIGQDESHLLPIQADALEIKCSTLQQEHTLSLANHKQEKGWGIEEIRSEPEIAWGVTKEKNYRSICSPDLQPVCTELPSGTTEEM